ncbi:MAG: ABC transporter permease, partial [Acidobacteriota bacterium]
MRFLEALRISIAAILAHKLRSFLTLLGVIFGVATVIVVVSLIEGFNKYVDEKIANIGTNAFSIQQYSIEDFASLEAYDQARRRNKEVRYADLGALRERSSAAIQAVGGQEQEMCEVRYADEVVYGVSLLALTANMNEIQNRTIETGRSFTPTEEETGRTVCFIGADIAERLFPTRSPIGQRIRIDGRPFEVIGVAEATGSVFG